MPYKNQYCNKHPTKHYCREKEKDLQFAFRYIFEREKKQYLNTSFEGGEILNSGHQKELWFKQNTEFEIRY